MTVFVVFVVLFCFVFSAWLEAEDDPVIERVNQRIEAITGLTVDTAELLQVMYCNTLTELYQSLKRHITQICDIVFFNMMTIHITDIKYIERMM